MQIVIDIPEYYYEWMRNLYGVPDEIRTEIAERIINGTVLPEKHGKITDIDELKKKYREAFCANMIDKERNLDLSEYAEDACNQFDLFINNNASAIIEATEEENE